jgi:3-methyladenine DNA glycosylase AlkD
MHDIKRIKSEVEAYMRRNGGDRAIIEKYSRYFKEGYDPYGVPSEKTLEFHKEFIRKYENELSLDEFLLLARALMESTKWEEKTTALAITRHIVKRLGREQLCEIVSWFSHEHNNWAICDSFSSEVFAPMLKSGSIAITDFESWRSSPHRWVRRVSIVSLINPMKAEKKVARYLEFVAPMMGETERVVHQGIGWFLREAWKIDSAATEKLLLKYKNTGARLIYQYACEKMDKTGKERFRRDK